MNIPLSVPDIGPLEIEYVTETLRSGHLSLGPRVPQFEEMFASRAGTRYAVAANSGTSALHLCIRALGIGPEDGVITTSFSFVASVNCILYERATPFLVDIDSSSLNIDPSKTRIFLEKECKRTSTGEVIHSETGRRVKAILPVHVFGMPCAMDAIMNLAREYGLFVLEDACEAIGAEYRGKRIGSFGDAAVFAFYPNKQMTTGEGGMIVTDNPQTAELCRSMRNQGRDASSQWLNHVRLGYNYRLSDVHAAIGLAQLSRIDEILLARAEVAQMYSERLAGHDILGVPAEANDGTRSWFVYVVQFRGGAPSELRHRVRTHLQSKGIASQIYFPAIHRQPYYRDHFRNRCHTLPETDRAAESCLALPFSTRLSRQDVQFVCDELLRVLDAEGRDHSLNPQNASVAGASVSVRP